MPELPDLEVYSQNLTHAFKGKEVKTLEVYSKKANVPAAEFAEKIEGHKLQAVEREGKELRFRFAGGNTLGLHLMLKGRMTYLKPGKEGKPNILKLVFVDDTGLTVSDFMGAATPSLNPKESDVPDAFSEDFNTEYLGKVLKKQGKTAVKTILLDQKIVRGIGNAYADEIFYECGISPFSKSGDVPENKVKELVSTSKSLMKEAVKQIKKADPEIISGEVRDFFKVHVFDRKETDKGEKILMKELNSRKTFYSENQVEYGKTGGLGF